LERKWPVAAWQSPYRTLPVNLKVEKPKLSPEIVADILDAADLIQVTFDECPELKELYYDQFSQMLDTAVKNSENKS
jgi:hypothetical protein